MHGRCDVCHRKPGYGHNVSHSNRKTNRRFVVNVQHRRLEIEGVMRNVYICTRCMRTMVKVPKDRTRTKTAKPAVAHA
ncbi:MAG TPA: 50S ribosomal protein L28 [Ktedonobacterales bacterium]|jgi:large subunit ribosomal protein L28